jgi:hypothetical protein
MKLADLLETQIPNVFQKKKFRKQRKVPKLRKGFYGVSTGLNSSPADCSADGAGADGGGGAGGE